MSRRLVRPARSSGRLARDDSGAAAVEFALVVPVLAMLLMGLVTAGLAYGHSIGMANAVREGARFGATTPTGGSWATSVIQRTRTTQADAFSTDTKVCVRLLKNTSGSATPTVPTYVVPGHSDCDGPSTITITGAPQAPPVEDGQCVALVWAVRPFVVNAVFFNGGGRLQRGSVARFERDC